MNIVSSVVSIASNVCISIIIIIKKDFAKKKKKKKKKKVSFARRVNKVRLLKALIVKKLLSVNLCFLYYFTSPVLLPACSLLTIHTPAYSTAMPGRLSLVQNVALHVINKSNATKFGQFFFRAKTIQKTSFTSLKVGFVRTVALKTRKSDDFRALHARFQKRAREMAALGVETSKSYL